MVFVFIFLQHTVGMNPMMKTNPGHACPACRLISQAALGAALSYDHANLPGLGVDGT